MTMTTRIPFITLNNGVDLPVLGLGVFQSPPEQTTSAVKAAIATGYPLIDTAASYFNEREVGEGIRESSIDRAKLFVQTKLWISDYGYDSALRAYDVSEVASIDALDMGVGGGPDPERIDTKLFTRTIPD